MTLMRILSQIVDLIVSLIILLCSYLFLLPALVSLIPAVPEVVWAVITLIVSIGLMVLIQYPFITVNQTLGKAFFGLEIVSTNPDRPLTTSILFQREVFGKLLSCYLICIPALFGRQGGHDLAAETKVVKKQRRQRTIHE